MGKRHRRDRRKTKAEGVELPLLSNNNYASFARTENSSDQTKRCSEDILALLIRFGYISAIDRRIQTVSKAIHKLFLNMKYSVNVPQYLMHDPLAREITLHFPLKKNECPDLQNLKLRRPRQSFFVVPADHTGLFSTDHTGYISIGSGIATLSSFALSLYNFVHMFWLLSVITCDRSGRCDSTDLIWRGPMAMALLFSAIITLSIFLESIPKLRSFKNNETNFENWAMETMGLDKNGAHQFRSVIQKIIKRQNLEAQEPLENNRLEPGMV